MKKIIAIHGAGMNSAVWDPLRPYLKGCDVVALTLPGHAPGDLAAPLADIDAMAGWVRSRLPSETCVVMGHSMGALVALELSGAPQVAGIVLMGAAVEMPVNVDLLRAAIGTPLEAANLVRKWSVYSKNPAADEIRAEMKKMMDAVSPLAIGADLKACDGFKAGENLARMINVPVLIIAGDSDKMDPPEKGRALADLISGADFKQITDCGHMMMLEKPAETAKFIQNFLGS